MNGPRILGATALALGAAAPFAGNLADGAGSTAIDVSALARIVAAQQDHVSALEVARWLRDGRAGLRVIDVRSADEFKRFSLPAAENIPIADIPAARFRDDETVVLYSEGGAHAAQAWVFLKASGVRNAVFIPGGLGDWFDEVMQPEMPADAPEARRAEITELSEYFGGTPRLVQPSETSTQGGRDGDTSALIANARRRGC